MYLLALALLTAPAFGDPDPCDSHAQFSCQAEFVFVSGMKGPGPEDAAHFQTHHGENGLTFCAAHAKMEVTGTGVRTDSTVALMGAAKEFSLYLTLGARHGRAPFTQEDENTIHADLDIASHPNVVFGGKTEQLRMLLVTCRYIP